MNTELRTVSKNLSSECKNCINFHCQDCYICTLCRAGKNGFQPSISACFKVLIATIDQREKRK